LTGERCTPPEMTTPPSHILPFPDLMPRQASLPLNRSLCWVSSFESPGFQPTLPVFVTQAAYSRLVDHASSEMENEVGGILVGDWCEDDQLGQQFIMVESSLPARFTRQGATYLTFTQDSLVDFHNLMDEQYPEKQMVGWYHTHPRMSVFLSRYDTWLHQNFFSASWQVALVIEPYSLTGGFFIRQADGVFDPDRYFGFYELDGGSGISVVNWNNLHLRSTGMMEKGVEENE
jgi:proteasome lid subunit RPN8/RPN11